MHPYLFTIILTISVWSPAYGSAGFNWNYEGYGPEVWPDVYPACGGSKQSPINIKTGCTVYQNISSFNFSESFYSPTNFTFLNNGHTITASLFDSKSNSISVTGGGLNGTFHFFNFHMHWGENYRSGSEHQVNGLKYAGELHCVFINPETKEIAVIGLFINTYRNLTAPDTREHRRRRKRVVAENTNNVTLDEWERYLSMAAKLDDIGNSTVASVNLQSLLGEYVTDFWRYSGSLTTPECTEGVIWTVLKRSVFLDDDWIEALRKSVISQDFREPQPLNDRSVFRNFHNDTASTISDYACCLRQSRTTTSLTGAANTISSLHLTFVFFSFFIYLII